jgi:DNA ligase 1
MILKKMYSQRSDGKVQEWMLEIDGSRYRTHAGINNGKIVTSKWTQAKAKNIGRSNYKSPEQQAMLEVEAKYKKQIEEGYSEDIKHLEVKFFSPMLAKNFEDYEDTIVYPVYSDRKYDGIRCITTKDGMFSRNGKSFVSVPHIFKSLKPLFKRYPSLILDGELYIDIAVPNFNHVCSLVKKTKPTDQDLINSQMVQYHVYDCGIGQIFSERERFLDVVLKGIPCIQIVEHKLVNSREELDAEYEQYLAEGYEGQIVRIDASYENKRSKFLLKRKEWITEEFKILDIIEGEGNRSGSAGYAVLDNPRGLTIKEKTFTSSFKGTYEYFQQLLNDRENLIGKQATVKYFRLTPKNVPRFPCVLTIRDYE